MPLHNQPQDHISSSMLCQSRSKEGRLTSQPQPGSQPRKRAGDRVGTRWAETGPFPLSAALTAPGSASCWAPPGVGSSPTEEQKRQELADGFAGLRLPQESAIKPMEALGEEGWVGSQTGRWEVQTASRWYFSRNSEHIWCMGLWCCGLFSLIG